MLLGASTKPLGKSKLHFKTSCGGIEQLDRSHVRWIECWMKRVDKSCLTLRKLSLFCYAKRLIALGFGNFNFKLACSKLSKHMNWTLSLN